MRMRSALPMADNNAKTHAEDAYLLKIVVIYAQLHGTWHPALEFQEPILSRLHLTHVGWLLHTMFSITGTIGYFEKATMAGEWVSVTSEDSVKAGSAFRYRADLKGMSFILPLNAERQGDDTNPLDYLMVTHPDVFPMAKSMSTVSTSAASASTGVSLDSQADYDAAIPQHLQSYFPHRYISTTNSDTTPSQQQFRAAVIERDRLDVFTRRFTPKACEAVHTVNPFNPLWVCVFIRVDLWILIMTSCLTSLDNLVSALAASPLSNGCKSNRSSMFAWACSYRYNTITTSMLST